MGFELRRAAWSAGLTILLLYPARAGDDTGDLFQRIKSHMSEHLARLPNYTCHETIERYVRTGSSYRHVDQVRLDVVFSGQRELYSRAGAGRFEDGAVEKLVSAGTIGNGALGSHIDLLLSQNEAEFKYVGTEKKDGHKSLRFDLTVPIEKSHFEVRHNSAEGVAGYQGSLWVDAETYDPVRVDFKVNRIPSYIGVRLIEESLHYRKLSIGNSEFSLPDHSELAATDDENVYTLNTAKLDGCREYSADSVVTFGPTPQGSAARERQDHK